MAKRQATTELNHDNWDRDEDKEEPGTFKPLSDSELQNRIIKRAKRSFKTDAESSPSRSPFSAFSGFSKHSPQPTFGIRPPETKLEKTVSDKKEEDTKNGCSGSFERKHISDVQKDNLLAKRLTSSSEEPKPDNKKYEYFKQLQTLNESVLKWMQLHLAKNPCCDFTPVFNDYKSHLQKLERMYPTQKKRTEVKSPFGDVAKNATFKIPEPMASKLSDSKSSSNTTAVSGFFKLGGNSSDSASTKPSTTDSEMLYGANFASNTTNTSTVCFGIKTSTATTTGSKSGVTSSFSSTAKEEEEEGQKETSGFSFGLKGSYGNQKLEDLNTQNSKKTFTFGLPSVSSNTESANNGEEEYVPPKNEFTLVSEEDALYSKRCKLFFKKGDAYVEKGVGTMYLKALDGKTQLLIRADTNLGNILLNIILSASLPMERTGKNNVLIVCVPNPPVDAKDPDSKDAIPLLIRVKTSDDADELFEKLNEYKS